MRGGLRNYLILWLATFILASLVLRVLHGQGSVGFWMATTSLPMDGGGSISVPKWMPIPLAEIWYYLILSIAGGISLAKILPVIAESATAHKWKRTVAWLSGLLCAAVLAYSISRLAYSVGAWQKVGSWVFYNTRGPFGPTLVFATAIIVARLLSNAAQSDRGKERLFLTLSGLTITGVLVMYVFPIFALKSPMTAKGPFITLFIIDGLIWVSLVVIMLVALVKLVAVAVRRSRMRVHT